MRGIFVTGNRGEQRHQLGSAVVDQNSLQARPGFVRRGAGDRQIDEQPCGPVDFFVGVAQAAADGADCCGSDIGRGAKYRR
jgi:hypothetical protein